MNDRFTEEEFKKADSDASFVAFHCHIGKYLIRLWGGHTAKSEPKKIMPSVSDYTDFEIEIFCTDKSNAPHLMQDGIFYYSVSPTRFGIQWSEIGWTNTSRGLHQSVATIRSVMEKMYKEETGHGNLVKRVEGLCRNHNCKKPNDVGVAECWWCGCPNPVC